MRKRHGPYLLSSCHNGNNSHPIKKKSAAVHSVPDKQWALAIARCAATGYRPLLQRRPACCWYLGS